MALSRLVRGALSTLTLAVRGWGDTKSRDPNSGASDSAVRAKVALWQGIAEITCTVADGIGDFSIAEAHIAADIVEEALCNAVRHGNADAVDVQVTYEVDEGRLCVHVRVEDHATGISEMRPGLGTAYLDGPAVTAGDAQFPQVEDVDLTRSCRYLRPRHDPDSG